MKIKRKVPLIIQKLVALLRRISPTHPKRPKIEKELRNRSSGHRGEESSDYYLSYLPENKYLILKGLRLPDGKGHYFQMDTLLLSTNVSLLLEVKNHSGMLTFDQKAKQLIREYDDRVEVYPDPITQVNRQQNQLSTLIQKAKFPQIPIIPLVVISNPRTGFRTMSNQPDITKKVLHAATIPDRIEEIDLRFKGDIFTQKDIKKLARLLNKKHTPLDTNILDYFGLDQSEIISGVHCPSCYKIPMIRLRGKWSCLFCKTVSKEAHIDTLNDYALLLNTTITNKQCREFLNISSPTIANKLLFSQNLPFTGTFKDRKYQLSSPE
ncbi:nuclease-related domain-containing protein [Alkalihalobacillus sp. AL-G]|uniref:nuclease-related domain-containing protein n=1 Tax=Alkalihalobacillus sp. AL-G TaxID=2926399 RepID=UPI002729B517|nr:nuclease-related domain-containing protein [Alkalihalobacillus sp. AL-G]WLD93920.1 NERD domain-containing protein [Alkalihalobacillus sp. AL-G]